VYRSDWNSPLNLRVGPYLVWARYSFAASETLCSLHVDLKCKRI
jgi:hypothetical protein